jgi:hypothetical protein
LTSVTQRRFAFAFGTAFALCYAVAVGRQLALFTVFPSLGIILPGTVQSRDVADPALSFLAPAMYWYGWTATASLGGLAAGVISLAIPEVWTAMGDPGRSDGGLRLFYLALVPALTEVAAVPSEAGAGRERGTYRAAVYSLAAAIGRPSIFHPFERFTSHHPG